MPDNAHSSGSLRAYLFDSWVLFLSPQLDRGEHKHGVMQLSISLTDAPHQVSTEQHGASEGTIHVIAPNTAHTFHCSTPTVVAWIEPESELGNRLSHNYLQARSHTTLGSELLHAVTDDDLVRALDERWSAEAFRPVGARLYNQLIGRIGAPPTVLHPAVRKALRIIRANPSNKIKASHLAREVGLSESRFLHTFSEHVGLPLRAYVRWRRVFGAMAMIAGSGTSATDTAAAMGFSDSAHLTRVMNDFLAISPSTYAKQTPVKLEVVDCTQAVVAD